MSDPRWIRVTTTGSIPRREGRAVSLAGHELAIFNLGDRFLAVENRCPHQGGPLADGIVSGCAVVCPLHAWRVRLDSGAVDRPGGSAACVRTFATRVEHDVVLVEIPGESFRPKTVDASRILPAEAGSHEERDVWLPPSGGRSDGARP